MRRRQFLTAGGTAALGVLAGCSGDADGPDGAARPTSGTAVGPPPDGASPSPGSASPTEPTAPSSATPTPTGVPRVTATVASGLTVPWAMDLDRDGTVLLAERDTALVKRVTPDGAVSVVGEVPGVRFREGTGEGGLLGLVLSPDGGAVLAYHSTPVDNRVVSLPLRAGGRRLGRPRLLLDRIPRAEYHDGGRLLVGPDGLLYVSTGDSLDTTLPQDTGSLGGKILRLTPTGRPAPGNPFGNEVFSYGHRNVQGLAFDAAGRLWATEFGDQTTDELNQVVRGGNYGWPEFEGRSDGSDPDVVEPATTWTTEECSPSGLAIVGSTAYVCALGGERLWAVPLRGRRAGRPQDHLRGTYGRIRAALPMPDGSLWVTTSNTDGRTTPGPDDDRILRVSL